MDQAGDKLADESQWQATNAYLSFTQNFLDSIPNPVYFKDSEGRYLACNIAFERFFSLPRDRIIGKTAYDVFPEEMADDFVTRDSELLDSLGVLVYESEFVSTDGVLRDLIFNQATYTDDEGNVTGIVGFIIDVTDRKQAEERLKVINRELTGYAHTVSHDLQGPLTAAAVASEVLQILMDQPQSEEVREKVKETAALLSRNVEKANTIVKDLLELAEAGQSPKKIVDVEVNAVVDGILLETAANTLESGRELRADLGDLGTIRANETQIYQLFYNLIDNALRHNRSDDPRIRIECVERGDGAMRFLVRDNGPGIPVEILDDVFTAFVKGEGGGTGIGLATVEKIVKIYGGEIKAYNDDGACFDFVLRNAE